MAIADIPHVTIDDKGTALITGTTTKVLELVHIKQATGWTAEELQQNLPHLTLSQVYASLSYYYDHKDEVDADIQRREADAGRILREIGQPISRRDLEQHRRRRA